MDIIASCIDVVYSEDESWSVTDCTKKELNEWLETLNTSQFKQIENFLRQCLNYLTQLRLLIQKQRLKVK